jgi:Tol biopolymer transport system component
VAEREASGVDPPGEAQKAAAAKEGGKGDGDPAKPAAKQIWIIRPDGGEPWPLTKSETNVEVFHWAKDGSSILFTASESPSKSGKARKERYSDYEVIEKDYEQSQLWQVDVAAAKKVTAPQTAKQLTFDRTLNIKSFDISPDSTRVAFSAGRNPLLANLKDEHVYIMDLPKAAASAAPVSKIVALSGPDGAPLFSPDGKQLAFTTSLGQAKFFYANSHLALVDVAAVVAKPATSPAEVRDLTKDFDENPAPIKWAPTGLYFGATQKMTARLFRLDPATLRVDHR